MTAHRTLPGICIRLDQPPCGHGDCLRLIIYNAGATSPAEACIRHKYARSPMHHVRMCMMPHLRSHCVRSAASQRHSETTLTVLRTM